jgi:acetylornithine deacetylase/succinyl-diaminopimelate desuccinylase family protein
LDDPVALAQALVQIDSSSPTLGSTPGPGETAIAQYIKAWLEHRDIESYIVEPTKGRPSVVGVVRGVGGGKSLILNGHIDTVTCLGYDGDPLSGQIEDGKLYGRGAADMKAGVAAAMVALASAKSLNLKGDVIFMGVADEEDASLGTQQVLDAGWTADAAIVSEPVNLEIIREHLGFVWVEVNIYGAAAHGSRPDLGVDAICKAGHFLAALESYNQEIMDRKREPGEMTGSAHASLIKGGEEPSSYPARCTITIERRTTSSETPDLIRKEIEEVLSGISSRVKDFKYDVRTTLSRPPFAIARDDPFLQLVELHVGEALGGDAVVRGERFWTDCALLAEKGIKALLWGPEGHGLHAKEEWVDVKSVQVVAETLSSIVKDYCA